MKKFKIVVKGNNYKTAVGSRVQEFGFYTTRFVEAHSAASAKKRALKMVERELEKVVFNKQTGLPVIEIPQFVEVDSFGDHDVPGSGFVWHKESKQQYA